MAAELAGHSTLYPMFLTSLANVDNQTIKVSRNLENSENLNQNFNDADIVKMF